MLTLEMKAKDFFQGINSVKHCLLKSVKSHTKQVFLNYCFVLNERELKIVTCKMSQIAMYKIAIKSNIKDKTKILIEPNTIKQVLKSFNKKDDIIVNIDIKNNKIIFNNNNIFVEDSLINLNYPEVELFFSDYCKEMISITNKKELIEYLKEIDKTNKNNIRPVMIEVKNDLLTLSNMNKMFEFDIEIKCNSNFKVFYNSKELITVLKNIKDKEVNLKFLHEDFGYMVIESSDKKHRELICKYRDFDENE